MDWVPPHNDEEVHGNLESYYVEHYTGESLMTEPGPWSIQYK